MAWNSRTPAFDAGLCGKSTSRFVVVGIESTVRGDRSVSGMLGLCFADRRFLESQYG